MSPDVRADFPSEYRDEQREDVTEQSGQNAFEDPYAGGPAAKEGDEKKGGKLLLAYGAAPGV